MPLNQSWNKYAKYISLIKFLFIRILYKTVQMFQPRIGKKAGNRPTKSEYSKIRKILIFTQRSLQASTKGQARREKVRQTDAFAHYLL